MKLYADTPVRRNVQIGGDLFALLVIVLTIWLGITLHEQVMELRAPGDGLVTAGTGLRTTFDSAADNADDVPLVGGALARALHTGSGAGARLADAGQWQIDAVIHLAWWLTAILITLPLGLLLLTWLPMRWRFVRRATAGVRLRAMGEAGTDLLALRALTTQRLPRLASAGDVAGGWRDRDPEVLAVLARWELERIGLHAH